MIDLEELEHRIATLRFRGVKGTTGTQASFLSLFDGDHAKVEQLDRMVTERFGFTKSFSVTGQTYPRKVDAQIVSALADSRRKRPQILQRHPSAGGDEADRRAVRGAAGRISAMAYKRNPMRCERATGLARFVLSLASSPLQTAAEQWFERTLDDSANKRLTIPEAFLAMDGCLRIVIDVARGLVVYPRTIEAAVNSELPFMATEEILMAAVRAGGDRQVLHERIRQHSISAAQEVKGKGDPNDLLDRLKRDAEFAGIHWAELMNPASFIGRSIQQVEMFVHQVIEPIRSQYQAFLAKEGPLQV